MKITILTIGSRGDVQPYVALGLGLQRAGHQVRLAASRDFAGFARDYGLEFAPMDASFQEMLQKTGGASGAKGRNPLKLMREAFVILRRVLDDSWRASQDADAVVFHPKTLAGEHIAEKLGVPAFAALPVPMLTPTREFASPILPPRLRLGGTFNRASTRLVLAGTTAPYRRMIGRWRAEALGLPARPPDTVPEPTVLYPVSPAVLPRPADWPENVHLTGYWFLDHQDGWQPPATLVRFLESGPAPLYIGFGSMTWNDAARAGRVVLDALARTGQRGVLATGYGGLSASELPDSVYALEAAPHDWLFPRMAAVVHHGGAGTTAAALRAGKPSVICPFLADQPFWGHRVYQLGAGARPIPQKQLTVERLTDAIRVVTTDASVRQRAAELGERIRAEDGVARAVEIIERTVERAASARRVSTPHE